MLRAFNKPAPSRLALVVLVWALVAGPALAQSTPPPSGYNRVEDEAVALTRRPTLRFVGATVTCADDASLRTTCTITAPPAGANLTLSNLTSPTAVNQSLVPSSANAFDLGSPTVPWQYGYFGSPTNNVKIQQRVYPGLGTNQVELLATGRVFISNGIGLANSAQVYMLDDSMLLFGTSPIGMMKYNSTQTPDTITLNVARSLVFGEYGDEGFDYAHATRAYPMAFFHSQSQSTSKWIGFGHDDTNGRIEVGSGAVTIPGSGTETVALGSSSSTFTRAVVVAPNSSGPGADEGTMVGARADTQNASATGATAIGSSSAARCFECIAIGRGAFAAAGHAQSMVFGNASTTAANQLVVGQVGRATKDWFAPVGVTSTTPENWTLNASGGSGTNIAGGRLILAGGRSTGSAAPGLVAVQTIAAGGASGTTAGTLVDRAIFGVFKALTNSATTTVTNVTLASNTAAAVRVHYAAEVFDGTELQIEEGDVSCHVTNKGGTFANNTCIKFGNQQAATGGTVTVTWSLTAANPALLQVNVASSLTPSTGYPRVTYDLFNLTQQAVVIQ